MTPSQYIKSQGLPSLAYVAKEGGCSARTLTNWYHNKHTLFTVVVAGVSKLKPQPDVPKQKDCKWVQLCDVDNCEAEAVTMDDLGNSRCNNHLPDVSEVKNDKN